MSKTDHYVLGVGIVRERLPGLHWKVLQDLRSLSVSLTDSVALANKGTDYVAVGLTKRVRPVGEGLWAGIDAQNQNFMVSLLRWLIPGIIPNLNSWMKICRIPVVIYQ